MIRPAGWVLFASQSEAALRADHVSFLKTLGLGLVAGDLDDDPSGIGTSSEN